MSSLLFRAHRQTAAGFQWKDSLALSLDMIPNRMPSLGWVRSFSRSVMELMMEAWAPGIVCLTSLCHFLVRWGGASTRTRWNPAREAAVMPM